MANTLSSNTWYVDTAYSTSADDLSGAQSVSYITVSATAANAVVVLSDPSTSAKKIDLRVATSGASAGFDFSRSPLVFPNGVRISTLTNAVAMLAVKPQGS